MGKYITIGILALIIMVVSVQTFKLFVRERDMGKQLQTSKEKMEALGKENTELQAQIDYVSRTENMEKELRAKLNYKRPEERVMIITP
jgi:peptidoglycan hydrolase CwlO-like protein